MASDCRLDKAAAAEVGLGSSWAGYCYNSLAVDFRSVGADFDSFEIDLLDREVVAEAYAEVDVEGCCCDYSPCTQVACLRDSGWVEEAG